MINSPKVGLLFAEFEPDDADAAIHEEEDKEQHKREDVAYQHIENHTRQTINDPPYPSIYLLDNHQTVG